MPANNGAAAQAKPDKHLPQLARRGCNVSQGPKRSRQRNAGREFAASS